MHQEQKGNAVTEVSHLNVVRRQIMFAVVLAGVLLTPGVAMAAWTGLFVISTVQIGLDGAVFVKPEGSVVNPHTPACSTPWAYKMDNTHPYRKDMLAMLLVAHATRSEIDIRTDGCTGGYVELNAVLMGTVPAPQ